MMKNLSKSFAIASVLTSLTLSVFALSPVSADGTGQIGGGNIYRIKNVTQNVDFTNPASANQCDELEYSVQLHNSGYVSVTNIVVGATLPSTSSTSNTSNMTATYSGGVVPSTSASATVNLSSAQSISYVNGTTQLLDNKGNAIKSLPDGVTGSGVNVGDLNGSTTEYVNFEAKVNCPTTPTPPVTPPSTTTTTTPAPTQLVNTGPGSVIGIFAAVTVIGAGVYRFILSRRFAQR